MYFASLKSYQLSFGWDFPLAAEIAFETCQGLVLKTKVGQGHSQDQGLAPQDQGLENLSPRTARRIKTKDLSSVGNFLDHRK